MIYNVRNRSNDATESQKEKRPLSMLILSIVVKYHGTKLTYTSQYCVCEHGQAF